MTGEKIKKLRTAYGYTRQIAAERLGVTPTTIQNWEIGKTEPNLLTLKAIAYDYGVTVDYLTGSDNDNTLDVSKMTRQRMIQTINSMTAEDIAALDRIILMFAGMPASRTKAGKQLYMKHLEQFQH